MQLEILSCALLLLFAQPREASSAMQPLLALKSNPADYIGTWVGRTADGEFKIVLKERKNYRLSNGKHSYVTSKSTVKNESFSKPETYFALFSIPSLSAPGTLQMVFGDNVNFKNIDVTLTFVTGSLKKLRWLVVGERETIITNPNEKLVVGVSVPTDLILEKVD